ncbi:MAG: glycosyltransferase family 39 protein [Polyangiaceae bacterium]
MALVILLALLLVRSAIAATTGLSDTEAYYASWARAPALSYYDHPPLVAWAGWLAIRTLGPGAVRVVPLACGVVFDVLVYRLGALIFSPRAGVFALALIAVLPVFFYTGFLVNPEALLAPLWMLFLLALLALRDHDEPWRPLVLGASVGAAFLAKYTGLLALPVALLYVASGAGTRRWLRRPSFYAGGLVSLAMASPVIVWNAARGWPSVGLHLGERQALRPESLAAALWRVGSAQMVYFHPLALPLLFAVLAFTVLRARRDERYRFLACASAPVLAFLLTVMVRTPDSEPHWTMVGYVPVVVAAGGLLDESAGLLRRVATVALGVIMVSFTAGGLAYGALVHSPMLQRALPVYVPADDPIGETVGWSDVRAAVRSEASKLGPGTVVAGAHNVLCGHLMWALGDAPHVYCESTRRTELDFMGRRALPDGVAVVFVDSDKYPADVNRVMAAYACGAREEVDAERDGVTVGRYGLRACVRR